MQRKKLPRKRAVLVLTRDAEPSVVIFYGCFRTAAAAPIAADAGAAIISHSFFLSFRIHTTGRSWPGVPSVVIIIAELADGRLAVGTKRRPHKQPPTRVHIARLFKPHPRATRHHALSIQRLALCVEQQLELGRVECGRSRLRRWDRGRGWVVIGFGEEQDGCVPTRHRPTRV